MIISSVKVVAQLRKKSTSHAKNPKGGGGS